jgi:DNA-binding NtrC family response regulator
MSKRILLFHNELGVLGATEAALVAEGFEVVAVNDSLTAWEMLSDVHRWFDVLITRVAGPEGSPPGLALARHFRTIKPHPCVIIIGRPDNAHFAEGIGRVLLAPVSADDVLNAVKAALASRRGAAKSA